MTKLKLKIKRAHAILILLITKFTKSRDLGHVITNSKILILRSHSKYMWAMTKVLTRGSWIFTSPYNKSLFFPKNK